MDPPQTEDTFQVRSTDTTPDSPREETPSGILSRRESRFPDKQLTGLPNGGSESHHVRKRQPLRALLVPALIGRLRRDSLLRNSLFIMLTTVVNSACGFIFWFVAARLFATQDVGLIAAITSASTIVVVLATIGVGGMLIQSLPQQSQSDSRWSTFWAGAVTAVAVSIVVGCVTIVLLPLISRHLSVLHSPGYAALFLVGTVALGTGSVVDSAFVAHRVAGNMFTRNSVNAAGKVVFVLVAAVLAGTKALSLLGAWAAAAILGLGVGAGVLVGRMRLPRPPKVSVLARTAFGLRRRLAGNQLIGIGAALLPYLLPLFVTTRLSLTENAYFYTTWMMGGVFLIIAPAVSQSLFAEGSHNPQEVLTRARSALGIIAAILAPLVAVIFVLGGLLLSALGKAYEQHALGLLRIVLLASIPDAIMNVYISVLRVRGRLMMAAGLSVGIGIGILALSWALLPVLGINAVGWAFLWMQAVGCVVMLFDLLGVSGFRRAVVFLRPRSTT